MSNTQYDYDKLFLAYEEARSDITAHFRKIMELQKELAEKDAVLAWYGDHNNYNHFPATSDPNCMAFVGFVEEKEAGDKAREILQKYRGNE